ncbi:MAG: CoA activase [Spirochaetes bacterium GWF1_51_8]|nr:MAG: CoA activase [Spirochaetes bacterium GWF1_51_8]
MSSAVYHVGLDVGSTTVKIAVTDPADYRLLHFEYKRHNAEQARTVLEMLADAHGRFPHAEFIIAVCGSGGQTISQVLGAFYIQEVVANALAIKNFYKDVRVAIELGGQDAKVVFFRYEPSTGQLVASDMRMNGSCAGGTGAFIDQIAEILHVKPEEFGALAERGEKVYDISGRCGVFAKTDIQPLLNQGVSKEDIALSSFHAIAKQTIGGLAQGMEFSPKVIFEGGPLTFNPKLIEVFRERLRLEADDTVIPEHPEILVAWGAAISIAAMFQDKVPEYSREKSLAAMKEYVENRIKTFTYEIENFFDNPAEGEAFTERHRLPEFTPKNYPAGTELDVYLGIDAGSTTSKFVLLDTVGEVVDLFYTNNMGEPLMVIRNALIELRERYRAKGVEFNILGVGTTGYGEMLFTKAFHADFHTVETVAHAEAAQKFAPDVSFVLDIGGQDMKAISLKSGIVTGIVLNEACSAGCGSFLETYARSLGIPVHEIAPRAFRAEHPSRLGSRCTVFMNSSIITEQKYGKTTEDILAGLCRSIIENVFTKVVRLSNFDALGDVIVVQGGTFRNDAVLRALEQYTGRNVIRPPYPGHMGAIGIALLTKEYIGKKRAEQPDYRSTFIGLDFMEAFFYTKEPGNICPFCTNNCSRTVVTFSDGTYYITGNRCEKGEIIGDPSNPEVKKLFGRSRKDLGNVPDLMKLQNQLLFADYQPRVYGEKRKLKIGIPRVLNFWESIPFWKALFTSLGFEVVISRRSSYELFEDGISYVPSDTVCFPAKLAHGHVQDLIERKVDRIFMPMMIRVPVENASADGSHVCSIVQGYPIVIANSDDPEKRHGIPFDHPVFHWFNHKLRVNQTAEFIVKTFGIPERVVRRAMREAEAVEKKIKRELERAGNQVLHSLRGTSDFAVILAGRPYHSDDLVNHNLSSHFTRLGIPVLILDSIADLKKQDLRNVRMETTIPYHTRMASAGLFAAKNPNIEIVQIVSFGCGHDAIISDEMSRILREVSDKELLILKLDEGEAVGPINIRIKSFVETIRSKREKMRKSTIPQKLVELKNAFVSKYIKRHRKEKIILAPNLSPAFSQLASGILGSLGYRVIPMPLADDRAIALGKKFVHNDICFPAQVNIGEALSLLEKGTYSPDEVALGLAKNCDDCRAGQYSALARKALDEAGYPQIPIITTGVDTKRIHPGFKIGIRFQIRALWGICINDALEMMRRRLRPYETIKGECDDLFDYYIKRLTGSIAKPKKVLLGILAEAVAAYNRIPVKMTKRRPRVGIVGEILLNFHPASNRNLERYLEEHGMEVVIPSMLDFFRRTAIIERDKSRRRLVPNPVINLLVSNLKEGLFDDAVKHVLAVMKDFRHADPHYTIYDVIEQVKKLMDVSYVAGEGWLLPGEICMLAERGVNSFVIVQPFGCLPNHITGRGMSKSLKNIYPQIQIVSLDFDPDTSMGNIENRLQMLIISAKELEKERKAAVSKKAVQS